MSDQQAWNELNEEIECLKQDKRCLDKMLDESQLEVKRLKLKTSVLQKLLAKHAPAFKTIQDAIEMKNSIEGAD